MPPTDQPIKNTTGVLIVGLFLVVPWPDCPNSRAVIPNPSAALSAAMIRQAPALTEEIDRSFFPVHESIDQCPWYRRRNYDFPV